MSYFDHNLKGILTHASFYQSLDNSQLERVVAATQCIRLKKDTTVVQRGDVSHGVYWIVYGQVSLTCLFLNGGEKVVALLDSNKCFGIGEMLLNKPFLTNALTTDDTMLLLTRPEPIMQIAQENFSFACEIMTCMGRQFYTLMADIESYSLFSAKQRMVQFLMRQSSRQNDADTVELLANKNLIASRLSLTPETFSRVLRDLSDAGVISVSGKHIHILDRQQMELLAPVPSSNAHMQTQRGLTV